MPSSVSVGEFGPLIAGRTFIVAEIGINHNGDLGLVRRLIAAAASAGCDAVKFQKRTVDVVYTPEELARPRANPFGPTNGDLKLGLELGREAYEQIEACCEAHQIQWSASCWDTGSVDFIAGFDPAFMKIASASLTDDDLLRHYRRTGKPLFLSTGMSTLAEMDHAVDVLGTEDLVLLHCTSSYPASHAEINLRCMGALRERYGIPVGYSGHERGIAPTLAAVALGACAIERHVTLDRSLWGSDQAASIETPELIRLVREVRAVEESLGDGTKRVYPSEESARAKLRRVHRTPSARVAHGPAVRA